MTDVRKLPQPNNATPAPEAARSHPPRAPLTYPADWVDETSQASGKTIGIVGSPFPKPNDRPAS
jgi:hypothetical protein